MKDKISKKYVSVIGQNFIEPILVLIEKLEEKPNTTGPNEVKTSGFENGFACSVITLSIFLLESAYNRTRFVRDESGKDDIAKYFGRLFKDDEIRRDVNEIIALRDAIVHNHLWKFDMHIDPAVSSLKFTHAPERLDGYGRGRFQNVLDEKTLCSKHLGLNLFPPRIWRSDAYKTFEIVYRVLAMLEELNHNYFTITYHFYMFSEGLQTLKQIIDTLEYPTKK